MAKEKQASSPDGSAVEQLAAELFVKAWDLKSSVTLDFLAEQCFAAAEIFQSVAEKVRSGTTASQLMAKRNEPIQNTGGETKTQESE